MIASGTIKLKSKEEKEPKEISLARISQWYILAIPKIKKARDKILSKR